MLSTSILVNPTFTSKSTELTGRQDIATTAGSLDIILSRLLKEKLELFVPTGSIITYSGSSVPDGFLLCDGSAVSRTIYATLFAVIGTLYGSGDGSTTFNVPDYRGRLLTGRDAGQAEFNVLGETGGNKTHTITLAEMPVHNHGGFTQSAGTHTHVITDPGHTHTITDPGHTHTGRSINDDFNNTSGNYGGVYTTPSYPGYDSGTLKTWTNVNNSSTTGVTNVINTTGITNQNAGAHQHIIDAEGGSNAMDILNPYRVVNYLIRTGNLPYFP